MTVAELIEKLSEARPDYRIWINRDGIEVELESININKLYREVVL